jgi:hypothetical protein
MQTFNESLQRKNAIEKQVNFFSSQLQKFPKNDIGLITDKTELYRVSKIGFDHWFKKLQEINIFINRNYKTEYAKLRQNMRFKQ